MMTAVTGMTAFFALATAVMFGGGAVVAQPASAAERHPNLFVDAEEIAAIKDKVQAGASPWKAAYDGMITSANEALSAPPQSVTSGGPMHPSGDIHDYYNIYVAPGQKPPNPDAHHDANAQQGVSGAVRYLGLGYAFTGDSKYAEKAISLIRTWCLDPATRMNSRFPDSDSQLSISHQGTIFLYGADLILNYPGWKDSERLAFVDWVRRLGASGKDDMERHGHHYMNNWENWRLAFLSAAGVAGEDPALRSYAFDQWKRLIETQARSDGALILELTRTQSLGYSLYALAPMTMGAEVARHFGVDLYGYRLPDGRGLEKVLDFLVPHLLDPSTWPYRQDDPIKGGPQMAVYEAAYSWEQKPSYMAVVNKWGRPYDYVGLMTLTHAH